MSEQRRAKRKPPSEAIEVVNAMTGTVIGRIGNLSIDGMMLIASEPLRDDALYQFMFSLPDARGDRAAIELGMHEQWSEPANTPGQYWAGFRLIDISDRDAELLRAWVERENAGGG